MLLAALKAFGPGREAAYAALPKWRSNAKRPSCLDLTTLLRKEAHRTPHYCKHSAFKSLQRK